MGGAMTIADYFAILCSVGLDPVGHGARVSAKHALLSRPGKKGRSKATALGLGECGDQQILAMSD